MRLILSRCGVLSLVISLANCSAWQATQVPLPELEGKKVRITTAEGERQEGRFVDIDSLGRAVLFHRRFAEPNAPAFDTTTIAAVEKRVYSTGRTLTVIVLPVAVVLSLYAWAYHAFSDDAS